MRHADRVADGDPRRAGRAGRSTRSPLRQQLDDARPRSSAGVGTGTTSRRRARRPATQPADEQDADAGDAERRPAADGGMSPPQPAEARRCRRPRRAAGAGPRPPRRRRRRRAVGDDRRRSTRRVSRLPLDVGLREARVEEAVERRPPSRSRPDSTRNGLIELGGVERATSCRRRPRRRRAPRRRVKIVVPSAKLLVLLGGDARPRSAMIVERLLGVRLDVVERVVPGVDELLDVLGPLRRPARGDTTMWSGIVPGKSALLNTTCEPGRSSAVSVNGANTPTQSNSPPAKRGRGGVGEHAAEVDVVLGEARPSRGPAGGGSGRRRPPRRRSSCPSRSSIEVIDSSQMMASLPVELSLTTTITCSLPAATPNIVSLSVWVLPSSWPAAMASSEPM